MARMIDIDDVERILWDHHFHDGDGLEALCDVVEILEDVRGHPGTVDIVQCKDCEHYYEEKGSCDLHDERGPDGEIEHRFYVTPDWFCADGGNKND